MSAPKLESPVKSFEDLLSSNYKLTVLADTVSESVLRDAANDSIFRELYEKKLLGNKLARNIPELAYTTFNRDNYLAWNVYFRPYKHFKDIILRNSPRIPVTFGIQKNSEFERMFNYYLLR